MAFDGKAEKPLWGEQEPVVVLNSIDELLDDICGFRRQAGPPCEARNILYSRGDEALESKLTQLRKKKLHQAGGSFSRDGREGWRARPKRGKNEEKTRKKRGKNEEKARKRDFSSFLPRFRLDLASVWARLGLDPPGPSTEAKMSGIFARAEKKKAQPLRVAPARCPQKVHENPGKGRPCEQPLPSPRGRAHDVEGSNRELQTQDRNGRCSPGQ